VSRRSDRKRAEQRRLAELDRVNHELEAGWEPVEPEDQPEEQAPDDPPAWAGLQPIRLGWTAVEPEEKGGWFG
jgi:hypothetical protein